VLELTDQQLARLAIAATGCAPQARSRWARLVAERFEACGFEEREGRGRNRDAQIGRV
jgi:hypothetical protein